MRIEDALLSVFPPPSLLSMNAAGIDISAGTVKCVTLKEAGLASELSSYLELPVPQGAIVEGGIESPEKVVDILRTMRLRLRLKYANASLSERKAYLYQTIVPLEAKSLRDGVEFDLEAHVPLAPAETIFDFEPVKTIDSGTVVSVTAYARRMIEQYLAMFQKAGIALRSLEVESQALARAVLPYHSSGSTMLIDFGRHTTRIAIAENGVVCFTATLDVGGEAMTSAVMKHFNVDEAEAERIKTEKGFLMSAENKELVESLANTVSVVKDEIAKHLSYWNTPSPDGIPRAPVSRIIVCGGNANLRGFPEYLEGRVGVPVSLAHVWQNAFSLNRYIPPMPFDASLEYATATGLALRGLPTQSWV
jgi:type IV pilus assembly protein PilM